MSATSSTPLTHAELLRRVKEGKEARTTGKEAKEKREAEKEKEREEEREELVSGVQKAVNFIIALVFVSMPLSEPEIDWLLVGVFVFVNAFWNLLLHKNTSYHMAMLLAWNFIITQYTTQIQALPAVLVTIEPITYAVFFGYNLVLSLAGYWFYLRDGAASPAVKAEREKMTEKEKQEDWDNRLDYVTLGIMGVNVVVGFATGVLTWTHVELLGRTLWQAVVNIAL